MYIIATPIGNLDDMTLRAIETLEKVEYLLCEDTRKSGLLLQNLGIKNKPKLISFYDEVERQKIPEVVRYLEENKEVGLVTDAGTPLISDPGWLLVKKCQEAGLKYTSIPGASSIINAVVLSGLPAGRFIYLGFLPKKQGERKRILENNKDFEGSKIVLESPFRLEKLIEEIIEVYGGECKVAIAREMTKRFEEVINGGAQQVLETIKKSPVKGEAVVVFI